MSNSIADRKKQEKLYEICHDYLIDNFHKFTEANKIKVASAICTKYIPQKFEGEGMETKIVIIRSDKQQTPNGWTGEDLSIVRTNGVVLNGSTNSETVSG